MNNEKKWAIEKKDNQGKFFALQPMSEQFNSHLVSYSSFNPISDWQSFLKKEKDWNLLKKQLEESDD